MDNNIVKSFKSLAINIHIIQINNNNNNESFIY